MENNRDIVILCSPLVTEFVSKTFEMQFNDQHLPASIIWSGQSCRYGQGMIVIEWEGEAPAHFLEQLRIDTDVIDYVMYQVPTVEGI